ncbi:autotransporter assembly complex protein TamA [Roseateles amylovorans]|uniref:BamA/TamA family outer membrane protein n=1 Tax=Roseateles amylovorans TaxID=2978473 RepID=A0ABY6B7N3_9BURK|nr:BamA/TamA family outer membrane protein [Roseateles amylovorans]UXH79565.1 BamA/TamA family outer membrane protein [Roseateles amylovorans]
MRALLTLTLGALMATLLGGCALLPSDRKAKLQVAAAEEPDDGRPEGERRRIASYELTVEAPPELRALLLQHLDLARFRDTPEDMRLTAAELRRLAAVAPEQARQLLETAGYFNAKVRTEEVGDLSDGVRNLRLVVDTGPRAMIGTLDLQIEGPLKAMADRGDKLAGALTRTLNQSWLLPPQTGFSQGDWAAAKNALLTRARAQGYPLARMTHSEAVVMADDNQVDLAVTLESGPLFTLGELQIEGLKHQPEAAVRRLAGYREHDPYNERLLLDFQERLVGTQLFDSASVEIQPEAVTPAPGVETVEVPVTAKLREAPRQQITTSLGYHSVDGPNVGIEHMHRKPFGLNIRERTKLNIGRDKRSIDTEISSHPQPGMQRSLAALYLERLKSSDDQVNVNLRARLGYARETEPEDRLDYIETLRSWEHAPNVETTVAGAVSLNEQRIWRRLDSKLLPTKGWSASLLVGGGWANSTTERNGPFGRAQAKVFWYSPLPSRWLLATRLEAGQIIAKGKLGLPEALRFRTGGDDSVRGYGYNELGPLDSAGNQTGGRVLLNGSVEVSHPLTPRVPQLMGAVFLDAGQAARNWGDYTPAWAYGAGLRYRSPVGVLRMDFAKGNLVDKFRLHFSVAIAL